MDRCTHWPQFRRELERVFATRTLAEWEAVFAGTDACVAPVLNMDQAPRHAHNRARASFIEVDGMLQLAPAPRFERTRATTPSSPVPAGTHTVQILREAGIQHSRIERLLQEGVVMAASLRS